MIEEYKINLLKLVGREDLCSTTLWWDEDIIFYVQCNDFFAYACADAETIESQEDLDLLEQCIKDCQAIESWAGTIGYELYCCRKRKCPPMPAALELIDKQFQHLFKEVKDGKHS
jgi:hypothetical protein